MFNSPGLGCSNPARANNQLLLDQLLKVTLNPQNVLPDKSDFVYQTKHSC